LALARRRIGTALTPVFYPYLSAAENLLTLAPLKGLKGSLAQSSTEELLQEVGLADVRKPFKQFSLGMKQRLNIAAALLGQPELVILDEPINGLDPKGIIEIRRLIRRYAREQGITFIISSHILSELDAVATCFGFLEQGVLLEELTREQLHAKTSSLEDYFLRLIGIEDEDEEGTGRMNGGHA
jgi:ABC-2 type transport system ATP-binding protein